MNGSIIRKIPLCRIWKPAQKEYLHLEQRQRSQRQKEETTHGTRITSANCLM